MCRCEAEKPQDVVVQLNTSIIAGRGDVGLLRQAVEEIMRQRQKTWVAEARAVAAERKLAAVREALG